MATEASIFELESLLLDEIPGGGGIFSKTLLKNEKINIVLMQLGEGEDLTEHSSGHAAVLHVLHGSGRVTLGDKETEVSQGTSIYMPPKLSHSVFTDKGVSFVLYMFK